jgi:hypothetical protein
MTDIVLTKEQIDKLILIYDQFKYFEDFTVTLSDDGTVSVKFEMDKVDRKAKQFIEETFRS